MRNSARSGIVVCSLLLGLSILAPGLGLGADSPLVLQFGVYTSDKPSDMFRAFKPIILYLEEAMAGKLKKQVAIKLRVFDSYEKARTALTSGEVDFARFGPSSYILAKQERPDVTILAIEEQEGKYEFDGVIFTREGTGIESIKDLKGRSFAFGDPDSTIGRYLSQSFLVDEGIYARNLSKFEHLDRHDRVVDAVLSGKYDAGVAKEGTVAKFKDRGVKTLKTFKNITKPWVARSRLDPAVAEALSQSLHALKEKKVLDAIGEKVTGFDLEHATDAQYEPVRRGMKQAEEFVKGPAAKKDGPARAGN